MIILGLIVLAVIVISFVIFYRELYGEIVAPILFSLLIGVMAIALIVGVISAFGTEHKTYTYIGTMNNGTKVMKIHHWSTVFGDKNTAVNHDDDNTVIYVNRDGKVIKSESNKNNDYVPIIVPVVTK